MSDFERIRAVKREARLRLLAIPGVHSVGIGAKYVAGRNTSEPAIIVFVKKKKALSELGPHEAIPAEIDGVKTDVVESDEPELHEDTSSYRPLRGGIQIQVGVSSIGHGTLGCIGITDEPTPRTVAITCHHVVTVWPGHVTDLTADVSPDQRTITFGGSNTEGSLVALQMIIMPAGPGPSQDEELFLVTGSADTPAMIATRLAAAINGLANPAVSAAAGGTNVNITWGGGFIVLVPDCRVYDVRVPDPSSNLTATVAGNVITLNGRASGDYYGIYVNMHPGHGRASGGVFTAAPKDTDLNTLAGFAATAINNAHITGITAAASGAQITIAGAQDVECILVGDARMGQPDHTFCSRCCSCCDDRIGKVVDARLDIDTALIQLDGGLKYRAEIEEIGIVTGTQTVTETDAMSGTFAVRKRGRTTGLTAGILRAVDVDGEIGITEDSGPPVKRLFHRDYHGALRVQSPTADPFSDHGDSGSAVVDSTGKVIGILFGGGSAFSLVTPIDAITSELSIHVATATTLGVDVTVPSPAGAHAETAPAPELLARVQQEIQAVPAGGRYMEILQRHFPEAHTLINNNRRVATSWHRNGGPEIVRGILRAAQFQNEPLPAEVNGKPLSECLDGLQSAFIRYGSPQLAADIDEYGPPLARLAGLTYPQALDTLRNLENK